MSRHQFAIPRSRLAQQYDSIQSEVDEAIARVVRRAVFTPDVEVKAFEGEFARYVGVRHAVGVSSGGTAVMLALRGLGIEPGDKVISVPNVDIPASGPIAHAGGHVVWTDVDPCTYNLDPQGLESKITPKTRAIVAVHMFGNPADMDPIMEIAGRHGIPVVEDAALAPGATYRGRKVGSIGDVACFSCNPNKILGAFGQAGVVVTNDTGLAQCVRVLSNYGLHPSSMDASDRGVAAEYVREGFNAAMDELQAAVLRVKFRHLDEWLWRRRENARVYREMLADLEPQHLLLPQDTPESEPAYRVFTIRSPQRDQLRVHLSALGIWTSSGYVPPLHLQPVYRHLGYGPGSFPQTELVARESLCLPTIPELSRQEVERVGEAIRRFFQA